MELLFKPASIDDIEAIYLLCKDLIDKYEDKSVIDYQKVLLWVKNKIEKSISEYQAIYYQGNRVGYVHCFINEDGIYEMYYDYQERVQYIVPHRILAMNRGEKEKFLRNLESKAFGEQLYQKWGLDADYNYRTVGRLVTVNQKVMILFDFNHPEVWKTTKSEGTA